MSNRLIILDDEPNKIPVSELRNCGFIPTITDYVTENNGIAKWIAGVFEQEGAEVTTYSDGTTMVTFTKVYLERYFRRYFDEWKRAADRFAAMDFEDFKTYRGAMKFEDTEKYFSKPNDIYVWNCGWYSTLSDFLRNVKDGETFYIGNSFYIS